MPKVLLKADAKKSLAGIEAGTPFIPPKPAFRDLRGFSIDPALATQSETASISHVTFRVPWEPLEPGPIGEYLEVIDVDPGNGLAYEPVDLNLAEILTQDGLAPSEGIPQFHQQMVYAVASLTIRNFEQALGRRTLWSPGPALDGKNPRDDSHFVPRLRIYPHALRERNAYYSPAKKALLFGYFKSSPAVPDQESPVGMVFTCLSHDIVAHETTHALLDGMNRGYLIPTNRDVHAFHEAFADLVALLQHFTFPEIVRHQIMATRGDLSSKESLLAQLAGQFGRGAGLRGALRDGIGKIVDGEWKPHRPDPTEYDRLTEPHERGAILVAAVFDAFLTIYKRRTADLLRLATGGSGVLAQGAIHPDLAERLSRAASKTAQQVLTMIVRALDYAPSMDLTFGEFLRAIITADFDLVPDDDLDYRIAFIEAFRRRGIFPRDVRTLSEESLLWNGPENDVCRPSGDLEKGLFRLRGRVMENLYTDSRQKLFETEREMRREIHNWLADHLKGKKNDAAYLGLESGQRFEVRTARIAYRMRPDGGVIPQLLLSVRQGRKVPLDPSAPGEEMLFEGGSVIVADLRSQKVRYCIRKSFASEGRLERQREFQQSRRSLQSAYLGLNPPEATEPFAVMHRKG